MKTNEETRKRDFRRQMLRTEFQSLFWHALLTRKKESGFSLKALADKLQINKAYVSRSFSRPPNWTIDKLADMSEALNLDLVVEARDRATGRLYTSSGNPTQIHTTTDQNILCDTPALNEGARPVSNFMLNEQDYQVSITA